MQEQSSSSVFVYYNACVWLHCNAHHQNHRTYNEQNKVEINKGDTGVAADMDFWFLM